jgi:hypothetical protein
LSDPFDTQRKEKKTTPKKKKEVGPWIWSKPKKKAKQKEKKPLGKGFKILTGVGIALIVLVLGLSYMGVPLNNLVRPQTITITDPITTTAYQSTLTSTCTEIQTTVGNVTEYQAITVHTTTSYYVQTLTRNQTQVLRVIQQSNSLANPC